MSDTLQRIESYKRDEIVARKSLLPIDELKAHARDATPVRPFENALARTAQSNGIGLIAEIKKASPSKGLIREHFIPAELARAYESGGATCLSVLTDGPSFKGHDAYLNEARSAVLLPALRKDFLYDPWQVIESRMLQADCILIIMAAVGDDVARSLHEEARSWGMDVLIEVHDERELERALRLPDGMVGINSRNLRTFETDLGIFDTLARQVPTDRLLVAESGIFTRDDVDRVIGQGASAMLVGESLMRQDDVAYATRSLLGT